MRSKVTTSVPSPSVTGLNRARRRNREATASDPLRGGKAIPVTSIWAALILAVTFGLAAPAQQGNDRFEQYLVKLGLTRLQALHLEQRLEAETEAAQRVAIGQRLADVYAGELVSEADDEQRSQAIMDRIERLIERVPEARTASLEVMLLLADYYRAENQITKWQADASNSEAQQAAIEMLRRIVPPLSDHQAELSKQVEQLINRIDSLEDAEELEAARSELNRIQAVAGRAMYFAATSNYYLALLTRPEGSRGFTVARDLFRKLLGIEGSYNDYDASVLGLGSAWRSRALTGLAMAEAAAGNREGSERCFSWLEDASVPSSVRDQVPYWRLQALLGSGDLTALLKFAQAEVAEYSNRATRGRVNFCVGLIRAGFGASGQAAESKQIGMLGLAGLIKIGQAPLAAKLLEEYDISVESDAGFYLKWIKGQQLLAKAQASKSPEDYEAAAEILAAALTARDTVKDVNAIAQCRSQLASCLFPLGEKEQAARLFEEAAEGLRASDDQGASKAAWNAFLAYKALSKDEPRFVASAVNILNQIKRHYPGSSYAKTADYEIGKLRQNNLSPDELLKRWENVPPGSTSYLSARFDICDVWYKLWKERSGAQKREAAQNLFTSVETFLKASKTENDPVRKVRACMWAVAVAVGSEPRDESRARRYLELAAPFAADLADSSDVAAEYHYRALELDGATLSADQLGEHEQWFQDHPNGTVYERVALMRMVKLREQALQNLSGERRAKATQILYQQLQRLAELLSADPRQARIAKSKLAEYASELGDHKTAARTLDEVLAMAGQGKNKHYLRRAGLAHYEAGQWESSLENWRVLLRGLPRGSDEWYEAKYYQLACLRQLDKARFQSVARQFQVLYPDMGSPTWNRRFAELLGN